jgi:hypothetical protein
MQNAWGKSKADKQQIERVEDRGSSVPKGTPVNVK